jgi:cytoskeletal protein CcmA (bactofilin family)
VAEQKPAAKSKKLSVTCPKCGHKQLEPPAAYSTVCKGCGQHFRVEDALKPAPKPAAAPRDVRRVTCFKCNTELEVSASAQSTMCKRCSSHMDLRDYEITNAVSRNFETKGRFVIQPGGYLFNSATTATDIVLKGRFLGKLHAENALEIHTGAEIKGSFKAAKLVIPAGERFHWSEPLKLEGAEIAGELVANIESAQKVVLKAAARLFGNVRASNLVIEAGAVIQGKIEVGVAQEPVAVPAPATPAAATRADIAVRTSAVPTRKKKVA